MKRLIDYKSRFRILKGGKVSLVISALLGSITLSFASPTGGTVTSGTANISQNGAVTNITQSTSKASINWQSFSIASNETVNFIQPNTSSITLNRVIGNETSVINGALNANGQVWILNSNGVLFGKNASINTAGLLATTSQLSDANFNAGNYNFTDATSNTIVNQGTIEVNDGGYVVLASNEVRNEGTIKAVKGNIHLVGTDSYSLNLNGNSLVNLTINKGVLDAMVSNSGTILADGGEIYLTTNAVDELLKGVVNNTGIIEANSLDELSGYVELFAHGGTAEIDGTIEAIDGFVETSGRYYDFLGADIKAGEWLIDPVNITIDHTLAYNIQSALQNGNVTISTLGHNNPDTSYAESGTEGNIIVNRDILWDNESTLTLLANNDIYVNAKINNLNNTKGGVLFLPQGSVIFETYGKVIINNIFQLQQINQALSGNYELGSNIDASATSTWNGGEGFVPLGINSNKFTGTFNGGDFVISDLYINRPTENNVGLFGATDTGSGIYFTYLENAEVVGAQNVGILVGYSNSTIYGSSTEGSVTGINSVGGLIGFNADNINYTFSRARATENTSDLSFGQIGGLVGTSQGSISNSFAIGDVTGDSKVGGLLGYSFFNGSVSNSYSIGKVTGNTETGGIIGSDITSNTSDTLFYDKTINPNMSDETLYGKTTAELQNIDTFSGYTIDEYETSGDNYFYPQHFPGGEGIIWLKFTRIETSSTPSTPTVTNSSTQQEKVADVITTIINETITKVELPKTILNPIVNNIPKLEAIKIQTPQMKQTNTNLAKNIGLENSKINIVSKINNGESANKVVTLAEIKTAMKGNSTTRNAQGIQEEVRVPLSKNSIVDLVNGGVNLPDGVDQQFFVVADNEN